MPSEVKKESATKSAATKSAATKSAESSSDIKKVPIQRTENSMFDESFSFMREKFVLEMMKMDEALNKFSSTLSNYQGSNTSQASNVDMIIDSPLIKGEGPDRVLKMHFDLSEFRPSEVDVTIDKDILHIAATHHEESDNIRVFREYKRNFVLPKGTMNEKVISMLSRDGVLTIEAPLPKEITMKDEAVKSLKAIDKVEKNK